MPLEQETLFNKLGDPPYSEADVKAKPILLMMGQYSTGKTTFIKALLQGREYPGTHIAAEMSTDKFTAVMRGTNDDIIPGMNDDGFCYVFLNWNSFQEMLLLIILNFHFTQLNLHLEKVSWIDLKDPLFLHLTMILETFLMM